MTSRVTKREETTYVSLHLSSFPPRRCVLHIHKSTIDDNRVICFHRPRGGVHPRSNVSTTSRGGIYSWRNPTPEDPNFPLRARATVTDYARRTRIALTSSCLNPRGQVANRMKEEGARGWPAPATRASSSCALSSAQLDASPSRTTTLSGGEPAAALACLCSQATLASTLRSVHPRLARAPPHSHPYTVFRAHPERRVDRLQRTFFLRVADDWLRDAMRGGEPHGPTDQSSYAGLVAGQPLRDDGRC